MNPSKSQVVESLRRVKGPDMQSNIVDLGLVSEILIKDGRVSFSITVPADRASELEPLRQAAEKIVREIEGVRSVMAVLTAERPRAGSGGNGADQASGRAESARVQEARARGSAPPPA
ncbi:MAG: iron-sulfur cluster assembly protein, partial [Hyphomicrobiaceae bacterium]